MKTISYSHLQKRCRILSKYSFATRARFVLLSLLFWGLSTIALLGGISSIATAQTITHVPLYTFEIENNVNIGRMTVSAAGDLNGDGRADLIVGAPRFGGLPGIVRVFSGSDGSVLNDFVSDNSNDGFASSVSGAGDVNGDGINDLIVGAPDDDNNGDRSGSARVFSGSDGSVLYNFDGESEGDQFGFSVSGAGDVNGDGKADVIVGAPYDDNNGPDSGSMRVLSGSDGSVLYNFDGDDADDRFGWSVSGAGDVNGDGKDDLIVGTRSDNNGENSGSARVLSGSDGSVLYNFYGDSVDDFFGSSVSGAGDVNGDGLADVIVSNSGDDGDEFGSNIGSARVFSGSDGSALFTFFGDNPRDLFGGPVSDAGDVNGDGVADVIVGGSGGIFSSSRKGSARVLSGNDGSVLYNFIGDSEDDFFGTSVSGAGDVNGDGVDDFIVSAWRALTAGGGYARVFVSQVTEPKLLLGDVNLDGLVDFLDIAPFISTLSAGNFLPQADTNEDGEINFLDISPFIALLSGQ